MKRMELGMEKPRTTWERKERKRDSEKEPKWVECRKCGNQFLIFGRKEDDFDFVCGRCKENVRTSVSMRCLRHKKRFNVPRWWPDVCSFLCPRCYDRLSSKERIKYYPKEGVDLSVHEAEEGKKTNRPSKTKSSYMHDREKKGKKEKNQQPSSDSNKVTLEELLPRYKISCKKCCQTVPCNYTWFDTSTVLCPSCYSRMTEYEISMFHGNNEMEKPRFPDSDYSYMSKRLMGKKSNWIEEDAASLNSGGCWTSERIMSVPKYKLMLAVKRGKVSKVRARIELKRRANAEYYDMFPEEVGASPIKVF